ncbi:MAG: serine/threonine-protein kinase, partial [Planctomycetota bacterium]
MSSDEPSDKPEPAPEDAGSPPTKEDGEKPPPALPKTVMNYTPSGRKPEPAPPDDPKSAFAGDQTCMPPLEKAGSVTAAIQRRLGGGGKISLPEEDLPTESIAGPSAEGRYTPMCEIARGGMGAIVKIVDNDIRRPVAMKVMLGEEEEERVARFVEEAQVTGQLEHPNIVPVHELGIDREGKVYFTMKLVKGKSLEHILDELADPDLPDRASASAKAPADKSRKSDSPDQVNQFPPKVDQADQYTLSRLLQIFLKICDAMAFAHSKGVIHRDLKPDNVMVGQFGEALVMDWGLAKVKGEKDRARAELVDTIRSSEAVGRTLSGEIMGTPSYMPPEQADGLVEKIDERSDVFALGGILYRILTFEPLYAGETVANVMMKAVAAAVVPPRKRSPLNRIAPELESICLKATAKKMARRYPSVESLAEDIHAYLDSRPVSAHRYGPVARFLRFVQRHPAGSLAAAAALLVATISAGIILTLTAW